MAGGRQTMRVVPEDIIPLWVQINFLWRVLDCSVPWLSFRVCTLTILIATRASVSKDALAILTTHVTGKYAAKYMYQEHDRHHLDMTPPLRYRVSVQMCIWYAMQSGQRAGKELASR